MSTANLTQTLTDTINNLADSPVILGAELLPPLADNLNNWSDLVEMSLDLPVTLTDNLNNWSDAVAITIVGDLQFTLADTTNSWSDSFTLLSDGQVILADNINNLADSPVALADGLLTLGDDLNQWADSASILGDELVTLADNLNNWQDFFRKFLGKVIEFDVCTPSGDQSGVTTYSWSHTCAGDDRILFVSVDILDANAGTVSSITYNGVPLTFIRRDRNSPYQSELWFLIAPALGTHTVTVTLAGFTGSVDSLAVSTSFAGVAQVSPVEANAGNIGNSNSATVNITTITDGDWLIDTVASRRGFDSPTGGDDRCSQLSGSLLLFGGNGTMGPISPPGLTTFAWQPNLNPDLWATSVAAFKSSGSVPSVTAGGDPNIVVGKPSRIQAGSLTIVGDD